ncbi:hypothetical protein C8J57DRAFT_1729028 [Mycena rebaudengoi]|nr:hypothetical protein C8J57DRAFT_1729028 [Mycena rebaudengoi]
MVTSYHAHSSSRKSHLLLEERGLTCRSCALNHLHGTRKAIKHGAGLHSLVFVMHGILVALHLGLLIISHYGLERRIRVPVGRPTTVLSLAIGISSQTFAIIYLAAVLYLTQRLALRRMLRSGTRTLTSIHDRQLAWSGLGSAANAWWNQLWVPASIWGVGTITLYLALTAGLKVTTPALFRLVLANQTASFAVNSTLSSPFLHSSLWRRGPNGYVGLDDIQLISYATFMASILMDKGGRTNDDFGLGLQNNILYDVVAADAGPGTTMVNTHTMHVTCGSSPTGRISEPFRPVTIDGGLYWSPTLAGFPHIPETVLNVLRIASPSLGFLDNSSMIDVYGSFNVGDTSGRVASQVVLEPPMNPMLIAGEIVKKMPESLLNYPNFNITTISNFTVSSLSYVRCSLAISSSFSPLDTSTRTPLKQDTPRKTTSSWDTGDSEYPYSPGDAERLWAWSLLISEPTFNVSSSSFCRRQGDLWPSTLVLPPCRFLSQAERALMNKLSVSPIDWPWWLRQSLEQDVVPVANVMLHDLENALEDYAAAFYWSLAYLRNLPTIQEVEVTSTQLMSQLQLDTLPVVAGMSFSVALLLISPILIGFRPSANKSKENIDFDTLGVLETVWLAGSESAVTAVEIPSTKHLRKAGMLVQTSACNWRGEDHPLRKRSSSFS